MELIPLSTARARLVDPPRPREGIALVAELPDAEVKIKGLAQYVYRRANADALEALSELPIRITEAKAAQAEYQRLAKRRNKTNLGHEEAVSKVSIWRQIGFYVLYLMSALAMASACYQTMNWILAAQIFDHLGYMDAALLTGIVLSTGIGVPLAWSTVIDTDADRKWFLIAMAAFSALAGAAWLASFVGVAWCQDRADFITLNGAHGSLLSLSALGALGSVGKAIMLPAGILSECGASVAIKLGISRVKERCVTRRWVPNAQRLALEEQTQAAENKLTEKRRELARVLALEAAFKSGLAAFVDASLAEHQLHRQGVVANSTVSHVNYIRHAGQ